MYCTSLEYLYTPVTVQTHLRAVASTFEVVRPMGVVYVPPLSHTFRHVAIVVSSGRERETVAAHLLIARHTLVLLITCACADVKATVKTGPAKTGPAGPLATAMHPTVLWVMDE